MSVEENMKVLDSHDKAYNERDWELSITNYTDDVVSYNPESPEPDRGIEALRKTGEEFIMSFPDIQMKGEVSFGQEDWIFRSYTITGTHTGYLTGPEDTKIPPTNRSLKMTAGVAYRFKEGKISEEHVYYDRLDFMEQLGLTN
jgi:predicted ester cyclase